MDPKSKGDLPTDYEPCGTCGYDHYYDPLTPEVSEAIREAHLHQSEDESEDILD